MANQNNPKRVVISENRGMRASTSGTGRKAIDGLRVIQRDPLDQDHVLFIGAGGEPVTEMDMFKRFSCDIPNAGPDTPDRVEADVSIEREFYEDDIFRAPDGRMIRIFGFTAPGQPPQFPSSTMRFVEGQIVHSTFHSKKNTHTIHHHGIEPTNFNDGVGHTSFEINSDYTYQFRCSRSGTYLYHCHKNTPLHFEMGMYGFLIVDPLVSQTTFQDGGPGFVYRGDEIVPYDVEALWAVDEFDSRWHEIINHQAGLDCPFYHADQNGAFKGVENVGLHDFNPDIFIITGVPILNPDPNAAEREPITDPKVAVRIGAGQTLLVRLLNAGYTIQRYTFHGLDAEVVDVDGRPLGKTPESAYSRPFAIAADEPFELTTARRYTMLIRPQRPGTYRFTVDYLDWVSRRVRGKAETIIQVEG